MTHPRGCSSLHLLGLAPQRGHFELKMPQEKGNNVMSFFATSQDSASREKGEAVEMGKTRPIRKRFGLWTRQQAPGKGGRNYHPGLGQWSKVAVAKEIVNSHGSGALEGGSNLFRDFENSVS